MLTFAGLVGPRCLQRRLMLRRCALLLILSLGCGGRDPLSVVTDDGTGAPPVVPADASSGGSNPCGNPSADAAPTQPPGPRDAGVMPPVPARDAAVPTLRADASPMPPAVDCMLPACIADLQ